MPWKSKEQKVANLIAEDMKLAVNFVLGGSVRQATVHFGISKSTLQYYVTKIRL